MSLMMITRMVLLLLLIRTVLPLCGGLVWLWSCLLGCDLIMQRLQLLAG